MARSSAERRARRQLKIGSLSHLRTGKMSILMGSLTINLLSLALPIAILQVYDRVLPNNADDTLSLLLLGVFVALALEAALRWARSYVSSWSAAKFEHEAGCAAIDRLLTTGLGDFERIAPGIHLERLNSLNALRDFYSGQAINAVVDFWFIFLFLGLIYVIGGALVAVPIGLIVIFGLIAWAVGLRLRRALRERMAADERRYNFIIEALTGIHTVKSMAMESLMIRRHDQLQRRCAENDQRTALASMAAISLGSVFSQLTIVLVAGSGSLLVISDQITLPGGLVIPGALSVGGLAACSLLAGRAIQPVQRALGIWTQFQSIKLARRRVDEIFDLAPENRPGAPKLPVLEGHIRLSDIRFSYGDGAPALFDGLDLHVAPGEAVAISGGNGTGKTSLLWLIMGALRPEGGAVRLDDHDPADFDAASVRAQIAYLPQHGVVFKGSILENITNFRKDIEIERVMEIAARLGLEDIILRLPAGYDTVVGDAAFESLPRGVKQRIALARALIDYPRIVLFDEANTALDAKGDSILQEVLAALKPHCTMVIVSHRPSTLQLADRQYLLEQGRLKPVGAEAGS